MKSILAKPAPEETGENRGLATMICPVCGSRVRERELERFYEEGNTDLTVELCTDCREEFEGDNDVKVEVDVIPGNVFRHLWDFVSAAGDKFGVESRGLNEQTAPAVADALGGEAWQSGCGIWLVMIRRKDGHVVVISDECVCEYDSEAAFEENKAGASVVLH